MRSASRDERGFTLVELMVVVLIIAILIAIAIPTFFGLKRRADDVAAKQAVALAVKTARSLSDDGTYTGVTSASLGQSQPSLTFVDGGVDSTGPSVVSQLLVGTTVFVTSSFSRAGACFFIRDDIDGGSQFGKLDPAGVADCNAANSGAVVFGLAW